MIIAGERYVLTEKEVNMYAVEMILHIKRLQSTDFGGYKCISKNSIGDTEGTIRLYVCYWLYKWSPPHTINCNRKPGLRIKHEYAGLIIALFNYFAMPPKSYERRNCFEMYNELFAAY
uniref:Immunoglobulin I-set domain-containing protein n=1 Tax=Glossina austeni TaxID=7395 RepID=A0A1A9UUS7_GLOAU